MIGDLISRAGNQCYTRSSLLRKEKHHTLKTPSPSKKEIVKENEQNDEEIQFHKGIFSQNRFHIPP